MKPRISLLAFAILSLAFPMLATDSTRLVDIGGRKLQVAVRGTGSPTIVIEAGMGEPPIESGSWSKVVDELSRSNRVVLYDRAGLGASDPAPKLPRTSSDVASDLDSLLTQAVIPGPYLLVGHSFGGLHLRLFASQYPEKVAGMVLVDASHPDQDQRWLASFGPASPDEPEPVKKARQFLTSRITSSANPESIDPRMTSTQIQGARGLGDKPLVILTHSAGFKMDPSLPDDTLRRIEAVWTEIQNEYRRLSTRSTLIQSKAGGHNLPGEDPDLVIAGIRTALDQAKEKAPTNGISASLISDVTTLQAGSTVWLGVRVEIPDEQKLEWSTEGGTPPTVEWQLPDGLKAALTRGRSIDGRSMLGDEVRASFTAPVTFLTRLKVSGDLAVGTTATLGARVSWRANAASGRTILSCKPLALPISDQAGVISAQSQVVSNAVKTLPLTEAQAGRFLLENGRERFGLGLQVLSETAGEVTITVPGSQAWVLTPGPQSSPLVDPARGPMARGERLRIALKPERRPGPDGKPALVVRLDGVIDVYDPEGKRWAIQLEQHIAQGISTP
jgi:pimeloyl-ACP methyl ester carboxylesterase